MPDVFALTSPVHPTRRRAAPCPPSPPYDRWSPAPGLLRAGGPILFKSLIRRSGVVAVRLASVRRLVQYQMYRADRPIDRIGRIGALVSSVFVMR